MLYKQKIRTIVNLLLSAVILVAVVAGIRCCLVGSYRISTPSMENSLAKGDFILVNKWEDHPERNRVILFASPLLKDTVNTPLFLSRCIGLPGDTIRVSSDGYTVNGRFFPLSPNSVCRYQIPDSVSEVLINILTRLQIPVRNISHEAGFTALSLTPFEEYSIREELSKEVNDVFLKQHAEEYRLTVPRKGRPYRINENVLVACKEAIVREAELPVAFRDKKLYIDGKETGFFFFDQDYYWVLSDNVDEGIDSRHLGFIPADKVLGVAWYCWFSRQTDHLFKAIH